MKNLAIRNKRLSDKLLALTEKTGVILDPDLVADLSPVLSDIDSLPLSDFQRIFWEQELGTYNRYHLHYMLSIIYVHVGLCIEEIGH